MGFDYVTGMDALFNLPLEDAVARFMDLRSEYLIKQENDRFRNEERIVAAAVDFQSRINDVRKIHPLYRASIMSTKLLPLRHCYDMHGYFPSLICKIPPEYPSSCADFDSETHLNELEAAISKEKALALGMP